MSVKVKNNNLIKCKKRVVLTYKLKKPVVLVGMMGAGKTAIGKSISALLSVKFIDLDEEISEAANMSISEIFSTYGEQFFRDKETKVLNRILNKTSIYESIESFKSAKPDIDFAFKKASKLTIPTGMQKFIDMFEENLES